MSNFDRSGQQEQRSGSDSLLIQAGRDVHLGLSAEQARVIVHETAKDVISQFSDEALSVIQERILKLDDRVIAALVRENRLHVFADPGFQRTYKRGQEGAAVSEREVDYDLIASLLGDRAKRGDNRQVRAGIEKAIEIIDQIDDASLRGLTVLQAVLQYQPAGGDIERGLEVMNRLLGQLIDGPLPAGHDWLDHLDILGAARISSGGMDVKFLRFRDFWPKFTFPGYLSQGAERAVVAKHWIVDGYSFGEMLVEHTFKEGFIRIATPRKSTTHQPPARHQ